MMSEPSDNFKDFFKDNPVLNVVILISSILFVTFFIILNTADINKGGILTLKILSSISAVILVFSIMFIFEPKILEKILALILYIFGIIAWFFGIIIWLISLIGVYIYAFFKLLITAMQIMLSKIYSIFGSMMEKWQITLGVILLLGFLVTSIVLTSKSLKFEKIFSDLKQYGEVKKIFLSIFVFAMFFIILLGLLPELYSSDISPGLKSALIVVFIVTIAILLGIFFMNEIFEGNYRNYGMLLFNIIIFLVFVYIIYGIKKFFFDPKSTTLENYSTFEYFLYYYLFPILFFVGYILYYIFVYRKEKLSFTDVSDYRVVFFDIFTGIIGLYLFYQFVIKKLLSASTDSPIIHFIQSIFKVIPCILFALSEYLIKNPSTGILSIALSAIFILIMVFLSGNVAYDSWYMILLYIIGSIATIAGIIKFLLSVTNLGETKIFKLLQKTIFTLPCLFLLGLDKAFGGQKFGTASEFLFIVLLIFFIFFYNAITTTIVPDLYERYILSGGKQVVNNPLPLTQKTFVSSYEDLFNFDNTQSEEVNPSKFDYGYGLSFWVYFDSFTPPNSQLYDVCSLGDGLMIKYNPVENTLYFMYKKKNIEEQGEEPVEEPVEENFTNLIQNIYKNDEESDEEENKNKKPLTIEGLNKWRIFKKRKQMLKKFLEQNNRLKTEGFENSSNDDVIIYKQSDVLLQRWNNIIVNYYGGTLDIFINGEMVASKINVAPYIINTALTVGMDNGINGDICNLIYYRSQMNKSDIYRMYHIFKDKNPPVINKSDTDVLNLGESLNVYVSELLSKNKK